ncbi:hypothetical protein LSTR_LSTR017110 [Laodelphax striatellus]|uniref:Uncharacterized protein n=1 Tax=Laodelphax striatellus TaxID=195883 RepID=A0A482WHG8_LAOST|nr:hypothetical protein LSTR_LSTR017110 [Laodelphax striatellus]
MDATPAKTWLFNRHVTWPCSENAHGLSVPSEVSETGRTRGGGPGARNVPQHTLDEARVRLSTKVVSLQQLVPNGSTSVRLTWQLA